MSSRRQRQERPRRRRLSDELRPYVDGSDIDWVDEAGESLSEARPLPSAAFRSELRARMIDLERHEPLGWRPAHLKAAIAAYAGFGLVLLGIAAAGVTGAGPLGY